MIFSRLKRIAAVVSAAVTALAFGAGCANDKEREEIVVPIYETKDIKYNTEEVTIGDITQKYYVDGGFGYPYYEKVSFKKDGLISEILVEENDTVKKGDLLCTLDSEELDKEIEEKAVYLEQAKKTVQTLRTEGEPSAAELQLAEVSVEVLQLEYDHLEQSYDDYKVFAPCDGVFKPDKKASFGRDITSQRGAESLIIEGGRVKAGQSFGTISDHSQEYLVCDVYDIQLENVNFGTKVSLEQGVTQAQGKVVDMIADNAGGMQVYTYVIEPQEDSDLSDLPVKCCFDVYSKLDTVIAPSEAIKKSKDRQYVELLIDGTKIEQDVETGIVDGDSTEILSGLSGGEQVIVN